ncbi:hypothetical protein [Sebaldella sp. S0638]|uniref:hypothetical protein n=1 Tax=Sebaldella sp. S0638 TaxID=2957809 RepID=UPI0020A1F83D|nr:hypothetical protein [Sebaldella sp. S0638]MCP1223790.1 hypothetical protein [Sebaldella sp. S0638]
MKRKVREIIRIDAFYRRENIEFLENSINEIENGKTVRKTFEELKFVAEEIRNN